ncbi:hypothetical protein [Umezawaea sp. Da 62-37]|uniref:hypothetical protein n=1 Tax=Umezawaea sp. Da 62-37 TaxID=3075927 RepID=UPI0028F73AFE|nr:hypothetical protein [Umezawaea sp. Da 62-37]WNV86674.1 hypothetical protein RM788_52605 [Umezawaea sp. Da 62-37]WNV86743.1 hypothetical protein RM788_00200 [Umezawaea sp. Da 62-37]
MSEQTASSFDTPWYLLLLLAIAEISSAAVATVGIGGAYAALELPAILTFAMPLAIHLTALCATWVGVRSIDPRRSNAMRQGVLALAAILMVLGALTTQLRISRFDLLAMIVGGVVSGTGPLLLALVLSPAPAKTPDAARQG